MPDIIPAQQPSAPAWAEHSEIEDGGRVVVYSLTRHVAQLYGGEPAPLDVEVVQTDAVTVDADGVRVDRDIAPTVLVGPVTLSVSQAAELGRVLVELAAGVSCDVDEPCASCGAPRDEHGLAVHAWTAGDR